MSFPIKLSLVLIQGILLSISALAATIQFDVVTVGTTAGMPEPNPPVQRYRYFVKDLPLLAYQEVDIVFSPLLYEHISNGTGGPGVDILLFQPNDPLGATGLFTAMALQDHPNLDTPLSVDFTFLGTGRPGSQPFVINQFDATGKFIATVASGETVVAAVGEIPEPGFLLPFCVAIGLGMGLRRKR